LKLQASLLAAAFLALAVSGVAADAATGDPPRRLVSLAPSVTELLFDLGLGDRVVGVTDWCRRPPAALAVAKVGGHLDPNLEAVVALLPDLVVLEAANTEAADGLRRLQVPFLAVEHRDVAGILASVSLAGEACGVLVRAAALRDSLEARVAAVHNARADGPHPLALVVVGRDATGGVLRDVYAAGGGTFLGELLELAGGRNAIEGGALRYPLLSQEGLVRLAPEVVVDLAPECADDPQRRDELRAAWELLHDVPAVRDGRVHIVLDDAALIPGPRFVETLDLLAEALDPTWTRTEP